jgi:hypothetical protein
MSRPAPTVLNTRLKDKKKYLVEELVSVKGVWAIFHQGQPFTSRTRSTATNFSPRYCSPLFFTESLANLKASKLKKNFKSDDFVVVQLY